MNAGFACCGSADPPCPTFEASCQNPANYPPCPNCGQPMENGDHYYRDGESGEYNGWLCEPQPGCGGQ